MTNSVAAPTTAVVVPTTVTPSKAGFLSLSTDLLKHIFKNLGVKELQIGEGVSKSWQKFTNDSHVWKPVVEKLRISSQANVRNEVVGFIKENLPAINEVLIEVLPEAFKKEILSIKHAYDQYIAIEKCLRENLKDKAFRETITKQTNDLIGLINREVDPYPSIHQSWAVQALIDNSVVPQESFGEQHKFWGSVIYELDYPQGFEEVYSTTNNLEEVLNNAIKRNNRAFVRFLLIKVEKSNDWPLLLSSLFKALAYGNAKAFFCDFNAAIFRDSQSYVLPYGEVSDSIINLIVDSLKTVNGIKAIFESAAKEWVDPIRCWTVPSNYPFMFEEEIEEALSREKSALQRLDEGISKLRSLLFGNH